MLKYTKYNNEYELIFSSKYGPQKTIVEIKTVNKTKREILLKKSVISKSTIKIWLDEQNEYEEYIGSKDVIFKKDKEKICLRNSKIKEDTFGYIIEYMYMLFLEQQD